MEQKPKRNTVSRTQRTLGQVLIGSLASWTLVETVVQNILPVLQQGEFRIAAIGALSIVLTTLASTVTNWYENRLAERKNSVMVED